MKLGDRVKLSAEGLACCFGGRENIPQRRSGIAPRSFRGVIIGYGRSPHTLTVHWDHSSVKTRHTFWHEFIEVVEDPPTDSDAPAAQSGSNTKA